MPHMALADMDKPEVMRHVFERFQDYDEEIRIPHLTAEGTSGAPLVTDAKGLAIGMAVDRRSVHELIAMPIRELRGFLVEHARSALPKGLKDLADNAGLRTTDAMHRVFRTDSENVYSNVELAGMISVMKERWHRDGTFTFPDTIGGCEVMEAAANRGLGVYAADLYMVTYEERAKDEQIVGDSLTSAAIARREAGDEKNASVLIDAAARHLLESYREFVVWTSDSVEDLGDEDEDDRFWTEATQEVLGDFKITRVAVPSDQETRQRLAMSLYMHHRAMKLGESWKVTGYSQNAARHMVATTALSSQLAVNSQSRSLSFEALGDVLWKLKRYSDAAEAFGSAWSGDQGNVGLVDKYNVALTREAISARSLKKLPKIWESTKLDKRKLRWLIMDLRVEAEDDR